MDKKKLAEEAMQRHAAWHGKIEVVARCQLNTREDLALAYTPGVAAPCLAIQEQPELSFTLTRRSNLVAVVTDGTAVLGLGDIGPEAGMPVMEGKCALFKAFADVDAFPLCIRSKDPDEIVRMVSLLAGSFGGINLEDIAAPRCFEIERRLQEVCDIPVFHDDQHGTAVVVAAALLNALRVVGKDIGQVRTVISGAGAAGMKINRIVNEGFMKTMLAAYLPGNSTVDLREVAVPTPGINQVLIKMKSSGICGSDVHYIYHQHRATAAAPDKPLYQGFINGHEPCGQIVRWGKAAAILKRATACWCITFLAVVFARTAAAAFLSLVLAKEKWLTAGSVTAVMPNICWRKKKI